MERLKWQSIFVILVLLFHVGILNAAPKWMLPVEGGYSYKITVEYGGKAFDGSIDDYHTDAKNAYYAIDFDNPVNKAHPKILAAAGGNGVVS